MEPSIKNGTEVLISGLFFSPKIGDIVAFRENEKFILKRIKKVIGDRVWVLGDNKKDSKEFGWIERKNILGRVVYILG